MSLDLTIEGRLMRVEEPITNNGYTSQRVVIKADETSQYPQVLQIELSSNAQKYISNHQPGAMLKLACNLRGREWSKDGKTGVFNTIQCWRIDKVEGYQEPQPVNNDGMPF